VINPRHTVLCKFCGWTESSLANDPYITYLYSVYTGHLQDHVEEVITYAEGFDSGPNYK
jgi:hypothetical protein